MIVIQIKDTETLIDTIKENPKERVVGVLPSFFPYFDLDKADELVGKKFLVQTRYEDRTFRTLLRMEGFTVKHSHLLNCRGTNDVHETLNKNGRFLTSHHLIGYERNGNHIYAYENEKVFKTLESAAKKTKKGVNWINLCAVHFWDEKTDFGKGDEVGCWEI
jgi:hypothetical protein